MSKSTKAFAWSDEVATKAAELYLAIIDEKGITYANNASEGLADIAKAIGAPSAPSVRSKLGSLKVYQKADKPRKVGGVVKTSKVHYIRALQKVAAANDVQLNPRALESLEQGVAADLADIVKLIEAISGEPIVVNPDAVATTGEPKVKGQVTARA